MMTAAGEKRRRQKEANVIMYQIAIIFFGIPLYCGNGCMQIKVQRASVLMVESRCTGPLSTLAPDEHLARASACFSLSLWRTMASQPRQSLMVCSYIARIFSSI